MQKFCINLRLMVNALLALPCFQIRLFQKDEIEILKAQEHENACSISEDHSRKSGKKIRSDEPIASLWFLQPRFCRVAPQEVRFETEITSSWSHNKSTSVKHVSMGIQQQRTTIHSSCFVYVISTCSTISKQLNDLLQYCSDCSKHVNVFDVQSMISSTTIPPYKYTI